MRLADAPHEGTSIRLQRVATNGHDVAHRTAGDEPMVLLCAPVPRGTITTLTSHPPGSGLESHSNKLCPS
jgi:hypothetical protein